MKTFRLGVAGVLSLLIFSGFLATSRAGDEKPPLVQKIEERLGIPLTMAQREEIAVASKEAATLTWEAAERYVSGVCGFLGFGPDFVKETLPPPGLPLSSLEKDVARAVQARLKEDLSREQTRALEMITDQRRASVKNVQAAYATRVSGIVDMPSDEILAMLTAE